MEDCSIYKRNVFSSPLATVQTLHILHTQHWGLIKAAAFGHCVCCCTSAVLPHSEYRELDKYCK